MVLKDYIKMRTIRFRAWFEKEMIYEGQNYGDTICIDKDFIFRFENIMQFTGLKDKNGKEIYEGDIVEGINDSSFEVSFKKGCFIGIVIKVDKFEYKYLEYSLHNLENIEIIGNIYENPELLK